MKDKIKITGIYKVISPRGLVYIGQSRNILGRLWGFKYNSKYNKKLNTSILELGWKNHKKEIIHELPKDVSQEVLNTYESLYMECYRDCGVELFNVREGGEGVGFGKFPEERKGWHHSEETKIKMRLSSIGRVSNRKRKVVCSVTGVIYDSAKEAAFEKGIKYTTLLMRLRGKYKTTLGYL